MSIRAAKTWGDFRCAPELTSTHTPLASYSEIKDEPRITFEAAYALYFERLVTYVRSQIHCDLETARDLAQDVFLKIAKDPKAHTLFTSTLASHAQQRSYLYRCAHNRYVDYVRRASLPAAQTVSLSLLDEDYSEQGTVDARAWLTHELFEGHNFDADVEEIVITREELRTVVAAMMRGRKRELRAVIANAFMGDYSPRKLATEHPNATYHSIKMLVLRARKRALLARAVFNTGYRASYPVADVAETSTRACTSETTITPTHEVEEKRDTPSNENAPAAA